MVKIEYFFKVGVFGEMILSIWLNIFEILLILFFEMFGFYLVKNMWIGVDILWSIYRI